MNNITPKEAIANLNHIYGMVAPDIQRSLDVAIKVLENQTLENQTTEGDLISREALKKDLISYVRDKFEFVCLSCVLDEIDNAQSVPQVTVFTESTDEKAIEDMKAELQSVIEPRPKGKWYDFIPNCLKARHGEYVLYKVDFLLDNLAREVNIMESARRMKGGAE